LVSQKITIAMTIAVESKKKLLTIGKYLQLEDKAFDKHEYHNGKLITMAGGTPTHGIIALKLAALLIAALKLKEAKNAVVGSDVKVWIPSGKSFVYPDAAIIADPIGYYPGKQGGIANPLLIVEVLSQSTEAYDRGEKFEKYGTISSLREYLLVSQTEPKIEVFYRQAAGSDWWQIQIFSGMEATARLQSIDCEIALADVFQGVEFEEKEEKTNGPSEE
jgi:Uma2 family endonuclease